MTTDLELLRRYAQQRSEDAFAALVNRHLDLGYSSALRQVRSPQLAEEVAQSVFADLARSVHKLKPDTFLTEEDWLNSARNKIDSDTDYRKAMSALRKAAENKFGSLLQRALRQYMQANNSQFPTDLSQLRPYFESPPDDAVLQRWQIAPADFIPNIRVGSEDWIVTQKASPVDEEYDSRFVFGPMGTGSNPYSMRPRP